MQARSFLSLSIAALLTLAATATARAQAPGATPTGPASNAPVYGPIQSDGPVEIKRYGHHVLLADGAALALTVATKEPGLILSYLFTGPAVHIAHGNPGRALGSFALRAGMPIVGGFLGAAMVCADDDDDFCGLAGFALGGLAGMVTAVIVDASAVARETVRKEPRVMPVATVSPSGNVQLGVSGRF